MKYNVEILYRGKVTIKVDDEYTDDVNLAAAHIFWRDVPDSHDIEITDQYEYAILK